MKVRHVDWYSDEWLVGTVELDNAQRGLYITACCLIYSTGGPITRDRLRAACRDHGHAFNRQLGALIAMGKLTINGEQITNKRSIKELQKAEERTIKFQQNGGKGGRPPKKNNDVAKAGGSGAEKLTINHQPSTTNQEGSVGSNEPTAGAAGEVSRAPNVVKMPARKVSKHDVWDSDDPKKTLYEFGRSVFGDKGAGIVTKFLGEARGNIDDAAELIEVCRKKDDPKAYAFGIIRQRAVQEEIDDIRRANAWAGAL